MIAARHKAGGLRVNNAAANYFLALRQVSGILVITFFSFLAWLLTRLPLPFVYIAGAGYGLGFVQLFFGVFLATRGRAAGKALLGSGAAMIFILTVSFLFEDTVFRFPLHPYSSIVLCMGLLIFFAVLAWRAMSQSLSLLTLSLALYLTYVLASQLPAMVFAIFMCVEAAVIVIWIVFWTTYRRERIFTHFAVFLTYGIFLVSGHRDILASVWIVAALTLFYGSMTVLSVDQVFRDQSRHRSLFFFSTANTLIYVLIGVLLFAAGTPGYLWVVMGAVCVVSVLAAGILFLVHGEGQLISMHAVAAMLALLTLLLLPVTPGLRLVMLAAGCLALALISLWRYDKLLRLTECGLLVSVFIVSFWLQTNTDFISVGPVALPTHWVWILAAAAVLCLTAWLHALRIKEGRHANIYSVEQNLLAFSCAITAALMITMHTIMARGDSEALPFVFAAQGMVFLGLGLVLFVPALAVAGLVPVIAGYTICYTLPYLVPTTIGTVSAIPVHHLYMLAAAALALALYTDYQVFSAREKQVDAYQKVLAAIPYIPAIVLFFVSIVNAPVSYFPAVAGVSALLFFLFLLCSPVIFPGVYASGILVTVLSVVFFFYGVVASATPVYALTWYLPLLLVYLLCLLAIERVFFLYLLPDSWKGSLLSYFLIIMIAVMGVAGLHSWNSGRIYFLSLFGLATLLFLSGYLFRARRYYHVATAVIVIAFVFLLLFGSQSMHAFAHPLIVR